jgi:hypothetical protein
MFRPGYDFSLSVSQYVSNTNFKEGITLKLRNRNFGHEINEKTGKEDSNSIK